MTHKNRKDLWLILQVLIWQAKAPHLTPSDVTLSFLLNHRATITFFSKTPQAALILPDSLVKSSLSLSLTFAIPLYHRADLSATARFTAAMLHDLFTNTALAAGQRDTDDKRLFNGIISHSLRQAQYLTAAWRWLDGLMRRNVWAHSSKFIFVIQSTKMVWKTCWEKHLLALLPGARLHDHYNFMSVWKIWSQHQRLFSLALHKN